MQHDGKVLGKSPWQRAGHPDRRHGLDIAQRTVHVEIIATGLALEDMVRSGAVDRRRLAWALDHHPVAGHVQSGFEQPGRIRIITGAASSPSPLKPHDIVIHPDGNSAYVSVEDDHTIHKITFDTTINNAHSLGNRSATIVTTLVIIICKRRKYIFPQHIIKLSIC